MTGERVDDSRRSLVAGLPLDSARQGSVALEDLGLIAKLVLVVSEIMSRNERVRLTPWELEVLQARITFDSYGEMARCLNCAPNTVKNHIVNIGRNFGVGQAERPAHPVCQAVMVAVVNDWLTTDHLPNKPLSSLTPRQTEVLPLIMKGLDNSQIADALVISPNVAKRHVGDILLDLGVTTRYQATAVGTKLAVGQIREALRETSG